jgi:hypothetical protein
MRAKIVSYECPAKGCTYSWVPNTGIGGKPAPGFTNRKQRRTGTIRAFHIVPACPTHGKNLVRHSEKMKV